MERTNIFFTSDWHVGHKNVLGFDNRPFKDLDHMHEVLVNNYNSTVRVGDVCYFLGDSGLCNADVLKNVITRLNGIKVCVLGNHDKGVEAMYKAGFNVVLNGAVLYIANNRVTLSHCPLKGVYREDCSEYPGQNWHGEQKNFKFTFTDEGQFHLHGHIHSPNKGKSVKILDKQWDIGVVANNYRPVSISAVESWIAKYGK